MKLILDTSLNNSLVLNYILFPHSFDNDNCLIISVRDPFILFTDYDILSYIPADVLAKLQSGEMNLVFNQGVEEYDIFRQQDYKGIPESDYKNIFNDTVIGKIENLCDQYNIKKVFYASPVDAVPELLYPSRINFVFYDEFLYQYGLKAANTTYPIELDTPYLYSCLNGGRLKPHRIETVYQLWKNGLLDQGKVSIQQVDHADAEFSAITPRVLDNKVNLHHQNNIDGEYTLLQDTCFYISCETHISSNLTYITEKTWRAILLKKPFFIVGDNGSIAKLHRLGFQTFGQWWDESYDQWDDQKTIMYVVNKIKELSINRDIINEMNTVLEHNAMVLADTTWYNEFQHKISKIG